MNENVIIEDSRLKPFLEGDSLADKARALLASQKEDWKLLRDGYSCLKEVRIKTFDFNDFKIKVQFNPGRITSTSAKVDRVSVNQRKCFLCSENLPPDQKGIIKDNYLVLCNPYPIFNEHFTIPGLNHVPQSIQDSFPVLLDFAKDLEKYYTIFYNGPKCGASAPDHLHFQAGEKFFMPLDEEYKVIKTSLGKMIFSNNDLEIYAVDRYLRRFMSFESDNKDALTKTFGLLLNILREGTLSAGEEPMLNVIVSWQKDIWRVIVFPREKHRPSHYFNEGNGNILLSPGAVDMGGMLITPLEKDFEKLSKQDIFDIYDEVTISTDNFRKTVLKLISNINAVV